MTGRNAERTDMITALLGWTKFPQWLLELIAIAAVAGGIWYWQHARFEQGIATQQAADAAQRQQLEADTIKKTAELQTKATLAEQAYDKERNDNAAYIGGHPIQPVRLCIAADNSRPIVPAAGASHSGNESPRSGAAAIQPLPSGDSGGGSRAAAPDIGNLLELLAARADDVSASLREFQNR